MSNNAHITIEAGNDGAEAQSWAAALVEMYLGCAKARELEVKVERIETHAGVSKAKLVIADAFEALAGESGTHRLVRISPFDEEKRRHTSYARVAVTHEETFRRSYVLDPYQKVTDHVTGITSDQPHLVLTGELERLATPRPRG